MKKKKGTLLLGKLSASVSVSVHPLTVVVVFFYDIMQYGAALHSVNISTITF